MLRGRPGQVARVLVALGVATLASSGLALADGGVSGVADSGAAVITGSGPTSGTGGSEPPGGGTSGGGAATGASGPQAGHGAAGGGAAQDDGGAAQGGGGGASPGGGSEPQEPRPVGTFEPIWSTRADTGAPCILLAYRPDVLPNSPVAIEWDVRTIDMRNDPRVAGADSTLCPVEVADGAASPVAAANDFVRRIPLPAPRLRIDPGFALTGLPAYLVIDGQDGFAVGEDLPGWGPMQVVLRPVRFAVDWGDGTVMDVSDGRLGAGHDADPSHQISHVYRWSDPTTVVGVRSDWRAVWQVGGFHGIVEGLMIDADLDLPVREYRAVRIDR